MKVAETMLDKFRPKQETFTRKEVIELMDSLFQGFAEGASKAILRNSKEEL